MKKLLLGLVLLTSGAAFAEQSAELKTCTETCLAFEEPGYGLRACIAQCLEAEEERLQTPKIEKFCETYEDCDDLF